MNSEYRSLTISLTDTEWMDLIDGSRPDGLQKCCANISSLRDCIISAARDGGEVHRFEVEQFRQTLGWVVDSHEIAGIPALDKLRDQIGLRNDPQHEPTKHPESLI